MSGAPLGRRAARERALELLYEQAIKDRPLSEITAALEVRPDNYTEVLLAAVDHERDRAEALIGACATGWSLERMAVVDRLIMVLALSELSTDDAPPRAVVLDEAVELARTYSSDASPAFVNGVLTACLAAGDRAEPPARN